MPLSPSINLWLRPGIDPDTANYRDRVHAVGSGLTANLWAVDRFFRDGKRDGNLGTSATSGSGKIQASCLLAGPDTLAGALVPVLSWMPTPTNVNFVAGDYDRTTGLKGNGVNKYLDLNRAANANPQNDRHISVYVAEPASIMGTVHVYLAAGNTTGADNLARNPTVGEYFARLSSSVATAQAQAAITGFLGCTRADAATILARFSGSETSSATASAATTSLSTLLFQRNGSSFTDARLAWGSTGLGVGAAGLTSLDTLLTAYMAALQ